ncbi:unnamed protein product [Brassica oleracea var. botrytis]
MPRKYRGTIVWGFKTSIFLGFFICYTIVMYTIEDSLYRLA